MYRYLLIGGFGFLGRHLIEGIERFEPTSKITVLTRSAPPFFLSKYDYWLATELSDALLRQLAADHNVVVHLASASVPGESTIVNEISSNVLPTVELITKLREHQPNMRFIYISSGGQIYGNRQHGKITETSALNPMSPYGFGKIMIEQSLKYLSTNFGASIGILRVGNPIGKWQRSTKQGIANVAIESILSDRPLTIYGNGNELRDYLDADAVAVAILKAAHYEDKFDIWNIGSGTGTKTIDVINAVSAAMGKLVNIQYQPRRAVDPEVIILDCKHAANSLSWHTRLDLQQLIQKTVAAKL